MFAKHPVAETASLLADPARIAMLTALLDGRARPAGELARIAHVSPQTASAHLSRLSEGRLITLTREGRHRYYRMASPEVGIALEALAVVSPAPKATRLMESEEHREMRFARTCYDHLAGTLAVQMADALVRSAHLRLGEREYAVSEKGEAFLETLGVCLAPLRQSRRPLARCCLDWTERRHHLAGSLGAALLSRFIELRWIARRPETRAVRLTHEGREALGEMLGIARSSAA
jgi:DNA-binding transcriptional ArsR family regulator